MFFSGILASRLQPQLYLCMLTVFKSILETPPCDVSTLGSESLMHFYLFSALAAQRKAE